MPKTQNRVYFEIDDQNGIVVPMPPADNAATSPAEARGAQPGPLEYKGTTLDCPHAPPALTLYRWSLLLSSPLRVSLHSAMSRLVSSGRREATEAGDRRPHFCRTILDSE
jgi:hypothetical protein